MPRIAPRLRPVCVTDAPFARGSPTTKKPPEKSLAESEHWRQIHRQPKTNAVSSVPWENDSQFFVKSVWLVGNRGFANENVFSAVAEDNAVSRADAPKSRLLGAGPTYSVTLVQA